MRLDLVNERTKEIKNILQSLLKTRFDSIVCINVINDFKSSCKSDLLR